MDESNVYNKWQCVRDNNEEVIRMWMQVKELIIMRDRYMNGIFYKERECNDIIELLCTGWPFCPGFIIVLYVLFWFWIGAV